MTHGYRPVRAALVAALLFSAGGVPAAAQDTPVPAAASVPPTGTLPGGVSYEVRPNPSQTAAAIALWYRAPAAGFDAKPIPGLSRLAAATVAASTPVTGTPLGRLVTQYGGRVRISAYPDSIAITALVPPERAGAIVRAMTADYFAPVVDARGFEAAQRDVAEDALLHTFEPSDAIEDAIGAALFSGGPFHDGTIASNSLGAVKLEQVRGYAERVFRPANAILILTGNVDPAVVRRAANRVGADSTPEPLPSPAPRAADATLQREAEVAGTGFGWVGPPISDEASATAMDFLADSLFTPKTGAVQRAVGNLKATVTGKFVTYHNPGLFLVTISGDDAAAARPLVERAIKAATVPMDKAAFAAARSAFVYRLLSQMETPPELADTYGWYAVEGNATYAPSENGAQGKYFRTALSLTPASVAKAAAQYLGSTPAIVTLVKRSAQSGHHS